MSLSASCSASFGSSSLVVVSGVASSATDLEPHLAALDARLEGAHRDVEVAPQLTTPTLWPSASTKRIEPSGGSSTVQTVTVSRMVVLVVTLFLLRNSDFNERARRSDPGPGFTAYLRN